MTFDRPYKNIAMPYLILFAFSLILIINNAHAQYQPKVTTKVTNVRKGDKTTKEVVMTRTVDMDDDTFLDDMDALEKYVHKHVKHSAGPKGNVEVGFVIDEHGALSNVRILKSLNKQIDAEVVKAVRSYPYKFTPSKQSGVAYGSKASTTIVFK
ncbi:energy transducer TonB [Mucilaginibacter daejeonensis]|uniref:energy transducer TonB n=1 Tax=Mucilaginibacter daejeonensis TaxID=398049 RepID=UPI001D175B22|nr:TonB family protein [Mucilaginibacter daejeonensis]UEG54430.1 energy transducer TonB [Mucilaginibacter daejeonensis]